MRFSHIGIQNQEYSDVIFISDLDILLSAELNFNKNAIPNITPIYKTLSAHTQAYYLSELAIHTKMLSFSLFFVSG